jgi:tetratricopeptide (TPR) repeat protein
MPVSTFTSTFTLLLLVALGLPAATPAQDDPRAVMFQARIKQQRAGGDDAKGAVLLYQKVIALEPFSSEAHLRLSEALVESGNIEGAVAPAVKATELNPLNAEAWVHLGLLQNLRGQTIPAARTLARAAFLEASRRLPNDPEVWFRLAQINQVLGDDESALKAWLSLGRLHPTLRFTDASLEDIAWERVALLGASLHRYEPRREAIMALCRAARPSQQHLQLLEELAREQADKGFLGHAEESFLLLGMHYPNEPAVWENISRIRLQTGRFEDALKTYRQAEILRPSPRLSYFQGLCLMSLGRLPEAELLWRRLFDANAVVADDPEYQQNTRFFYAASLLLQGRPQDMLGLLQGWPGSERQSELLALKAQGLIQTKAWKDARAVMEDGMKRFPEQSLFRAAKAASPKLLLDTPVLKKDGMQALLQLDFESMAALWGEFQQWDKCLEMVRLAYSAAPTRRLELFMMQSNALDQLGRPEEAIQILREAQKRNASYPMLQNNLGYLLLENGGDLQEAGRLIEAAMNQNPKNGSTVDSWGWVLFKQGKFKEAEEALRKAVELTPFSPEIRKHLGEVLLKLDRPEEALEQWERALAFAFPQRAELEAQAEKLRVELAKKQRAQEKLSEPSSQDPEEAPIEEEATP